MRTDMARGSTEWVPGATPLLEYARRGQALLGIPVFDMHAHIDSMAGLPAPPLAVQVAEMDRVGIDVTAISSLLAINGCCRRGNDNVAAACQQFPGRFIGYCHISGSYPELMQAELERCFADTSFRGIKLYQVGRPFDDPAFAPAWEFAQQRGIPVLAHTWGGQLTGLDRVAARMPEVAVIAAHTGSDLAYGAYITAARQWPNFHLDLTYSREHTNMIEHIVEAVGGERVLWGTDYPIFGLTHQISKLLFARISDADKRRILYDNAARLFGLPAPPPP